MPCILLRHFTTQKLIQRCLIDSPFPTRILLPCICNLRDLPARFCSTQSDASNEMWVERLSSRKTRSRVAACVL
jgi:hypothetical protein